MKKILFLIFIFLINFNASFAVEEIHLETEKNTFEYLSDVYYGKVEDANPLFKLFSKKGLEFKNVFLIGMDEGIFPHNNSFFDNETEISSAIFF